MILTAIAKYKVSESKYHGSIWESGGIGLLFKTASSTKLDISYVVLF